VYRDRATEAARLFVLHAAESATSRWKGAAQVTDLDAITDTMQAISAGIAEARQRAVAADSAIQAVAARMANTGFTGIANAVSRTRPALATAQSALVSAIATVEELLTSLRLVPPSPTPQQVIAALEPVSTALAGCRDAIRAAMTALAQTQQLVSTALRGGQPGPLTAALTSMSQILTMVDQHTRTAVQQIHDAIDTARQTGHPSGGPGPAPPATTAEEIVDLFGQPAVTRPAVVPGDAAPFDEAIASRVPPYGAHGQKTTGILVLSGGRELPPQHSGIAGPARRIPRPRPGMDGNLVTHVEAHAVGAMREAKLTEATLYVNREPCVYPGTRPGEQWGCALALPDMLHPGEKLTVYGPAGYVKVYYGRPR
jgi:hypothetical protein